jgi:prepilin-type N-terminal cleavage/methylation domain-containing protein
MEKFLKRMHGGQKGFTLIELLVVIAILGVIAAVVALNVAGFFGRGTLQAANTELHQAQTSIVAAMADAESNNITVAGTAWAGETNYVVAHAAGGGTFDAADYCYGPFRAAYEVSTDPATIGAIVGGDPDIDGGWGTGIIWSAEYMNWEEN